MRCRKFWSGVNWEGALNKKKSVIQTGVKENFRVPTFYNTDLQPAPREFCILPPAGTYVNYVLCKNWTIFKPFGFTTYYYFATCGPLPSPGVWPFFWTPMFRNLPSLTLRSATKMEATYPPKSWGEGASIFQATRRHVAKYKDRSTGHCDNQSTDGS